MPMNECDRIGMQGDCGPTCSEWLEGRCAIADEWSDTLSPEDLATYHEIYGGEA